MNEYAPLRVRVWGDHACFTRPELKAERVSYPVMTPSAARGVLEAIFWKPEAIWRVESVAVLHPVRWFQMRRNEVQSFASPRTVRGWAANGGIGSYVAEADRDQRATLGLRDVAYLVSARLDPVSGREADLAKYRDQFRRRVARGSCFHQPYLGCREFAASFGPPVDGEHPVDWDEPLGLMFWGFDYGTNPPASRWFDARVQGGVLALPAEPLAGEPGRA